MLCSVHMPTLMLIHEVLLARDTLHRYSRGHVRILKRCFMSIKIIVNQFFFIFSQEIPT